MLIWFLTTAAAQPFRAPLQRSIDLQAGYGRHDDRLTVKLAEGSGARWSEGQLLGLDDDLAQLLAGARPLFARPAATLRADRAAFDPEGRLADLSLYVTVRSSAAAALGARLQRHPQIECAYLAFAAVPPPSDIPPTTPDFTDQQTYMGAAPDGFGFSEAARWPGGDGSNVSIANIEYGWEPEHEDLGAIQPTVAWGWNSEQYSC